MYTYKRTFLPEGLSFALMQPQVSLGFFLVLNLLGREVGTSANESSFDGGQISAPEIF